MKRTLLRWHLGLGDALICNGLVRCLVDRGDALMLPCYSHNLDSVQAMFLDLGVMVEFIVVGHDNYESSAFHAEIGIGYFGPGFNPSRWDESFYRQAGVPFIEKFEGFKLPSMPSFPAAPVPFIHDDPERGFHIQLQGYRPFNKGTIFDNLHELMAAPEIHCINSAFANLADLVRAPGKKFLHRYSRPDGGELPIFGQHWKVLDRPL